MRLLALSECPHEHWQQPTVIISWWSTGSGYCGRPRRRRAAWARTPSAMTRRAMAGGSRRAAAGGPRAPQSAAWPLSARASGHRKPTASAAPQRKATWPRRSHATAAWPSLAAATRPSAEGRAASMRLGTAQHEASVVGRAQHEEAKVLRDSSSHEIGHRKSYGYWHVASGAIPGRGL